MDEVNYFLHLANQMGLIRGLYEQALDIKGKCSTWKIIQESHLKREDENIIKLRDIRGMIILLSIGLSASLLTFIVELIMHNMIKKIRKQAL